MKAFLILSLIFCSNLTFASVGTEPTPQPSQPQPVQPIKPIRQAHMRAAVQKTTSTPLPDGSYSSATETACVLDFQIPVYDLRHAGAGIASPQVAYCKTTYRGKSYTLPVDGMVIIEGWSATDLSSPSKYVSADFGSYVEEGDSGSVYFGTKDLSTKSLIGFTTNPPIECPANGCSSIQEFFSVVFDVTDDQQ